MADILEFDFKRCYNFARLNIYMTKEELLAYLEERLGKFKLPRLFEFRLDQLPKTGTGKIRKNILREGFWTGKEKRVQG